MAHDCHGSISRQDHQAILHHTYSHVSKVLISILKVIRSERHAILADILAGGDIAARLTRELKELTQIQFIVAFKVITDNHLGVSIIRYRQTMFRNRHVCGGRSNHQTILHYRDDNIVEVRVRILEIVRREPHTILADSKTRCNRVIQRSDKHKIFPLVQIIIASEVITTHHMGVSIVFMRQSMLRNRHIHRDRRDFQAILLYYRDDHPIEVSVRILEIVHRECHTILAHLCALSDAIAFRTREHQVIAPIQGIVAFEVVAAHAMLLTIVCHRHVVFCNRHVNRYRQDGQTILHHFERNILEVRVGVLEHRLIEGHAIVADVDSPSCRVILRSVEPHIVLHIQWVVAAEVIARQDMLSTVERDGIGVLRDRHDDTFKRSNNQLSIRNIERHIAEVRVNIRELVFVQIHWIRTNSRSLNR